MEKVKNSNEQQDRETDQQMRSTTRGIERKTRTGNGLGRQGAQQMDRKKTRGEESNTTLSWKRDGAGTARTEKNRGTGSRKNMAGGGDGHKIAMDRKERQIIKQYL